MPRIDKQSDRERGVTSDATSVERTDSRSGGWLSVASIVGQALLIGIAILVVFSNALDGQFLFDDEYSIEKNISIRTIWPLSQSLWAAQDTPTAGRPIVNLSLALNYAVGRQEVFVYHLTNVSLHILNAVLLYALIHWSLVKPIEHESPRTLLSSMPFFVALLWAVHPLQTETVNYATQRTELLMAFFFFSTMLSARIAWDTTSFRTRLFWQGVCVVSCTLGMASKEVMVVVPVIVVLYDLAVMKQSPSFLWKSRGRFYLGLALTWFILAALLSTNPRGRTVGFGLSINPFEYLAIQSWAITQYLWLAIFPVNLCGDYGVLRLSEIPIWLPYFLFQVALAGLTFWAWFRWRIVSFLGLWFFAILAPSSSIVPIVSEPVAERRMYLPLAALLVLAFVGVSKLERGWSNRHRWKFVLVWLAIAGIYACTSHARNKVYQSDLAFWTDVIQKRPRNARGCQNLGYVYFHEGQVELARMNFERAKELAPTEADSHYNLGVWHLEHGYPDEAMAHFDRSLEIKPDKFDAIFNRALLLSRMGRLDESVMAYSTAIDVSPKSAIAYLNLGNVLRSQERLDEAVEKYRAALQVDPELSVACQNLGAVFAQKGEFRTAIQWLEKAIKIDPKKSDAYNNLGYCYASLGQTDEAVSAYRQCVSIQPTDADAWNSLGKVYVDQGEKAKARACFERVLQLQPDSIEARQELQKITP